MPADRHLSPQEFFHVTTEPSIPSIRKHGLDNTLAEVGPWDNVDDWDDGTYLWDNRGGAEDYLEYLGDLGHSPRLLGVHVSGSPGLRDLPVTPDDTGDSKVYGAWHTPQVPRSHIRYM